MDVTRRIRLTLPEHYFQRFDDASARSKTPLAQLIAAELRSRLDATDIVLQSGSEILEAVSAQQQETVKARAVSNETHQAAIETLLLLRVLAGPEQVSDLHRVMLDAQFIPYGVTPHGR